MSVYLVLCLLLAYPARLCVLAQRQGRSAQHVALAISCAVLWFFMAMRAQTVGVDTKYYVCIYQQFPQISWKELFTAQLYPTPRRTWELDLEPGYRLLNKLLSIYRHYDHDKNKTDNRSEAVECLWMIFGIAIMIGGVALTVCFIENQLLPSSSSVFHDLQTFQMPQCLK